MPFPLRIARSIATRVMASRRARLCVLDEHDAPVGGATVTLAGRTILTTNAQGIVDFYLPEATSFIVVVDFAGVEEILYDERLTPGVTHTYRRDPDVLTARLSTLAKAPTKAPSK